MQSWWFVLPTSFIIDFSLSIANKLCDGQPEYQGFYSSYGWRFFNTISRVAWRPTHSTKQCLSPGGKVGWVWHQSLSIMKCWELTNTADRYTSTWKLHIGYSVIVYHFPTSKCISLLYRSRFNRKTRNLHNFEDLPSYGKCWYAFCQTQVHIQDDSMFHSHCYVHLRSQFISLCFELYKVLNIWIPATYELESMWKEADVF